MLNKKILKTGIALVAALSISACTSRSKEVVVDDQAPVQVPGDSADGSNNVVVTGPGGVSGGTTDGGVQGNQTGEFPVQFEEKTLKAAYEIDTSNLKYHFKYLETDQRGDINFDAEGKAQLTFKNLKVGQSGTMLLELLEGDVVKLKGEKTVTLNAGANNNVALVLKKVDGGGDNSTTDLVLDVTLDDGVNNGGGDNNNGGGDNNNGGGDNNNGGGDNTTPDPDPIADWNGREFKGNSEWKIIAID